MSHECPIESKATAQAVSGFAKESLKGKTIAKLTHIPRNKTRLVCNTFCLSRILPAQASRRRKRKVDNESVKAAIKAIGQMFATTVPAGRSFKNIPLAMIIM
jgi:hypothetical protein